MGAEWQTCGARQVQEDGQVMLVCRLLVLTSLLYPGDGAGERLRGVPLSGEKRPRRVPEDAQLAARPQHAQSAKDRQSGHRWVFAATVQPP